MSYSQFIMAVFAIYVVYYAANILYDAFLKQSKTNTGEEEEIISIGEEEEIPHKVVDEDFETGSYEKEDEKKESEQNYVSVNESIEMDIETQGIPMKKFFSKIAQRAFALAISTMVVTNTFAQGAAGIDAASSELATYMDPLGNMMMILGGLVGLVGAVRVYLKWNSGDQDVQKAVMGWMGSCIFLVVSGVVVKAFFGI